MEQDKITKILEMKASEQVKIRTAWEKGRLEVMNIVQDKLTYPDDRELWANIRQKVNEED